MPLSSPLSSPRQSPKRPAAKLKAQKSPGKSYLPVNWKEEQDRFRELTVISYKTQYTVEPGESHITGKNVETTKFKVHQTRKSQGKNQDGN
jgi:hypothetical protein